MPMNEEENLKELQEEQQRCLEELRKLKESNCNNKNEEEKSGGINNAI